jgi:hypothetical protein
MLSTSDGTTILIIDDPAPLALPTKEAMDNVREWYERARLKVGVFVIPWRPGDLLDTSPRPRG